VDRPTNLLRWSVDGDVLNDRRFQSSMDTFESWCLLQQSLDQRHCMSATCSIRSSQSDRDATKKNIITEPSADDFYQYSNPFLDADAGYVLNWSHGSEQRLDRVSRPVLHDLAMNSKESSRIALKVDSPAGNDSIFPRFHESTSFPPDNVQGNVANEENCQVCSSPITCTVAAAAAGGSVATTTDAPRTLNQ